MNEHLPECPILKPCCDDEEFPEHGFCGNFVGGRCLNCMAECICDALRACENRVIASAVQRVNAIEVPFDMDDRLRACEELVIAEAVQRVGSLWGFTDVHGQMGKPGVKWVDLGLVIARIESKEISND